MPKLIIDSQEIDVPPGTKVIEAAEILGIMIPRFCYHPALGSVGACRVCAVKFLQGPFKGLQMSYLVYQGDQEPVRIAHGIDRDLMTPIRQGPVVPMPRHAFIYNPQMYTGIPNELQTWGDCPWW